MNELLLKAVVLDRYEIVEFFITRDLNIDMTECIDKEGNNCLMLSALNSNIRIGKLILKFFHHLLEHKNHNGVDALTISVYNNDNLMFFLLANNLNYTVLNISELCKLAIRNENFEVLEYLSNIYKEDSTMLHYACAQKNLGIFNHIVGTTKNFEEKDSNGETPLHWAVMKGGYHILEALLKILKQKQCNIDPKSRYGITPFHLAMIKQDKNIAKLLYDYGADVNDIDNEGNSAVHMLASIGDVKWLKFVVKHYNVNCYQKNHKGNTPIMLACLSGRYEIVEYFVDKIPNLNWKNKNGQTPLHAAVYSNDIKIIELLLKHKADITMKDIVHIYINLERFNTLSLRIRREEGRSDQGNTFDSECKYGEKIVVMIYII